jgi:hypothetical protein
VFKEGPVLFNHKTKGKYTTFHPTVEYVNEQQIKFEYFPLRVSFRTHQDSSRFNHDENSKGNKLDCVFIETANAIPLIKAQENKMQLVLDSKGKVKNPPKRAPQNYKPQAPDYPSLPRGGTGPLRNEKPATLGAWGKDTTQKAVEKGADPNAGILIAVQQMMEANEKRESKRDEELKNLQETIATRMDALELRMSKSNKNTMVMEKKDALLNVDVIISKNPKH